MYIWVQDLLPCSSSDGQHPLDQGLGLAGLGFALQALVVATSETREGEMLLGMAEEIVGRLSISNHCLYLLWIMCFDISNLFCGGFSPFCIGITFFPFLSRGLFEFWYIFALAWEFLFLGYQEKNTYGTVHCMYTQRTYVLKAIMVGSTLQTSNRYFLLDFVPIITYARGKCILLKAVILLMSWDRVLR